jgi:hypothetical protein
VPSLDGCRVRQREEVFFAAVCKNALRGYPPFCGDILRCGTKGGLLPGTARNKKGLFNYVGYEKSL